MSGWRQKRSVMRRYDQSATVYDTQYREEQNAKIQTALESLELDQQSISLDVGCGTGLLFDYTAGKMRFVIGVDFSRGILREAKRRAKQYANVDLIMADADSLPFFSEAFDLVSALTLLQNIPDPKVALSEIKRVGNLNSTMIITGLKKSFTAGRFHDLLKEADLEVLTFESDKQQREYVLVCTKLRR